MIISNFIAYAKQAWKNKPDTSTPLSAARLTHLEDGVKGNSDAIEKIAAAVVSQIVNDPNKIASMAALYSVNEKVDSAISDLGNYMPGSSTFSSWVSDPDTVNTPFALLNGWSAQLQHAPDGLYQHWGVLITFWNARSEIGDLSKPRTQCVMFNSVTQARYFSGDTKKWSVWGAS